MEPFNKKWVGAAIPIFMAIVTIILAQTFYQISKPTAKILLSVTLRNMPLETPSEEPDTAQNWQNRYSRKKKYTVNRSLPYRIEQNKVSIDEEKLLAFGFGIDWFIYDPATELLEPVTSEVATSLTLQQIKHTFRQTAEVKSAVLDRKLDVLNDQLYYTSSWATYTTSLPPLRNKETSYRFVGWVEE